MYEYLELGTDEAVILKSEYVVHHNPNKWATLFLTNKNIICIKKEGIIKKRYEVIKYPISQIKNLNDDIMVGVQKDPFYNFWILRVQMLNGIEEFKFHFNATQIKERLKEVELFKENILKYSKC